jgi:hypothetical protein
LLVEAPLRMLVSRLYFRTAAGCPLRHQKCRVKLSGGRCRTHEIATCTHNNDACTFTFITAPCSTDLDPAFALGDVDAEVRGEGEVAVVRVSAHAAVRAHAREERLETGHLAA